VIKKCAVVFAIMVICQGAGTHISRSPPVRSDLPLTFAQSWPQADHQGLSAASLFALGDWRSTRLGCSPGAPICVTWLRWNFGSVFDPFFTFSLAAQQQYLAHVYDDAGVVGELGRVPGRESLDLFAIQFGTRGGSEYVIVSASRERPIKRLTVLNVQCEDENGDQIQTPDVELRRSGMGIQPTDYCAVRSAEGLRNLALAALARKEVAVMEWVGEVPAIEP
jgi:hypothetical protein